MGTLKPSPSVPLCFLFTSPLYQACRHTSYFLNKRLWHRYYCIVSPKRKAVYPYQHHYCCLENVQTDHKVFSELKQCLKRTSVYLVGLMGSGKSTIGQQLAIQLGYFFLDTDELIEKVAKKTIKEIFRDEGEDSFREIESSVLDQVQSYLSCVVATGGGAVLRKSNWGYLHNGIVVFLDVATQIIIPRLVHDTSRPLLQVSNPQEKLEELRRERLPLYLQADVHVKIDSMEQTTDETVLLVAKEMLQFIKQHAVTSKRKY